MIKTRMIYLILALILGVFFFIYGGYDDSPGAQGIGLLVVIASLVGIIKKKRK